jgi:hypothetical protein
MGSVRLKKQWAYWGWKMSGTFLSETFLIWQIIFRGKFLLTLIADFDYFNVSGVVH